MIKSYLDMAKENFRSIAVHRNVLAMSVHTRQELDLKISVAFSRMMTKAYTWTWPRKDLGLYLGVAQHRNSPGNYRNRPQH